eukprot:g774.t1
MLAPVGHEAEKSEKYDHEEPPPIFVKTGSNYSSQLWTWRPALLCYRYKQAPKGAQPANMLDVLRVEAFDQYDSHTHTLGNLWDRLAQAFSLRRNVGAGEHSPTCLGHCLATFIGGNALARQARRDAPAGTILDNAETLASMVGGWLIPSFRSDRRGARDICFILSRAARAHSCTWLPTHGSPERVRSANCDAARPKEGQRPAGAAAGAGPGAPSYEVPKLHKCPKYANGIISAITATPDLSGAAPEVMERVKKGPYEHFDTYAKEKAPAPCPSEVGIPRKARQLRFSGSQASASGAMS